MKQAIPREANSHDRISTARSHVQEDAFPTMFISCEERDSKSAKWPINKDTGHMDLVRRLFASVAVANGVLGLLSITNSKVRDGLGVRVI